MKPEINRKDCRKIRHERIRRRMAGTAERPRMAVMISNRNIYVQFIDDVQQKTLASASSLALDAGNATLARARTVGQAAARAAADAGIRRVVVDRGGFKYHGRVKALVEGAAEAGLQIRTEQVVVPASAGEAAEQVKEES